MGSWVLKMYKVSLGVSYRIVRVEREMVRVS